MKKSFVTTFLTILLLLLLVATTAVGCEPTKQPEGQLDTSALIAEIALEIAEQGDYTAESYNAYVEKLQLAKQIASDTQTTQQAIDQATAQLAEARLALELRTVDLVPNANVQFNMTSGDSTEVVLADYFNTNGLSKISYKILASNPAVELGEIANGKFTITAGTVQGKLVAKVAINVYYDNVAKHSVELTVTIKNEVAPTVVEQEFCANYDLVDLETEQSITLDFAQNVQNLGELPLQFSATHNGESLQLDGSLYTFQLGSYTEQTTYEIFEVQIDCTVNGKPTTVAYTYKLGLKDTRAYQVANGNFENGLDGWTLTNTHGEAPFAGIDEKSTFWNEGYPVFNVGKYFSAYADGALEASQGTLASSFFVANSNYATFMLGGAGNHNVYVTVENSDGQVLALFRNTKFADFTEQDNAMSVEDRRAMVGNTIFLVNLVTYKVDIAEFRGQEIRFVIHDHASSGWGVVYFDELVTYYETDDAVPENATLATNLLADKTQLNAEIALEIAEQGDYTADSFNTYTEKLNQAKALVADVAVAQSTVDQALNELKNARLNLAVRSVEEVEGGKRSFRLISGNSVEVVLANYVEENGLSSISYTVQCDSANVTLSQIADGKFSITAGQVDEAIHATVTISVLYKGEQQLAVQLDVEITNDIAPVLRSQEIATEHDVFELDDKQQMLLDLSENVDNVGNLQLTYSAKIGENELAVDGAVCTFVLGTYGDSITYETIAVTVSFMANGEQQTLTYTYKLGLKDTTANRLANGGFENGLEGWTVVGNIGNVDTATHYWLNDPESAEGFAFGMDGEKMFSAYAPEAAEGAVGTLTSSTFTVGGSGFVTFKVGAMRDGNYVYVDVVDAETKQILVRYYNGLWAERTNEVKSGCTLVAYKADLSDLMGKQVFFRISDNADSGYGLFFVDSFITYYENEPAETFNVATPVDYAVSGTIYDLFNGGFEMGDVQGWWNNGEPGKVTNANAFFSGVEYGKNGEFLYSGVEDYQAGNGREGNTGVLTSSAFQLGGTGYISYMLGGGNEFCYVQVIDATTGQVLARFRQQAREDAVLKLYVADLSEHVGKTVRIQLVDNATNNWGCVSFDNVVTYHTSIPTGITAIDVKYEIANGSFESGMLGWKMNITETGAHDTLGWVESSEHDAGWYTKNDGRKDGNNLFTFCRPDGTNCENSKGTLESATFTLKQGAYVSFRFGGAGTRDVYVQLCNANGEVIATFFNEAEGKQNTEMYAYFYQYMGETADCFFRVVDNSTSNYGCFVVDDFRVNLESAPEGFLPAVQ